MAFMGAIAASMVGSLFSSDSWNNVTFIAGEIKRPERNIGLSLFLGTLIVTATYFLCNVMYLSVLSLQEIATAEKRPCWNGCFTTYFWRNRHDGYCCISDDFYFRL